MRYWVFSEQQLEAALAKYLARFRRLHALADRDAAEVDIEEALIESGIRNFLDSTEARVFKLQGGASYVPDVKP